MNTEALHLFNRCFSVCMDCAMSQHQTYSVDPASSVSVFDPDEPGALERVSERVARPSAAVA